MTKYHLSFCVLIFLPPLLPSVISYSMQWCDALSKCHSYSIRRRRHYSNDDHKVNWTYQHCTSYLHREHHDLPKLINIANYKLFFCTRNMRRNDAAFSKVRKRSTLINVSRIFYIHVSTCADVFILRFYICFLLTCRLISFDFSSEYIQR